MGRNLGILNIVSSALSGGAAIASEGMNISMGKGVGNDLIRGNYGLINRLSQLGESVIQYQYKYDGGMRSDYERTADAQGSGSLNPLINNQSVIIQEEVLQPQARKIVQQRYFMKGYKVNRFLPFYFWNNRINFNYVEFEDFASVFNNNLPKPLKRAINEIMENGIRVWNVYQTYINWDLLSTNFEINKNNNEIAALNGDN